MRLLPVVGVVVVVLTACSTRDHEPEVALDAPTGSDATTDASSTPTRPAGVALCYSAAAEAHPATAAFRAAMRTNDRAARAGAITALDAAVQALPNEEQLHLFLGLAHLWRLGEPQPGEDGLFDQLADATASRDHLRKAYQLCPTDHRIAAWLGPVLIQFGRRLNDTNQIAEGLMILDQGIAAYPAFVLFSKLLVYADSPRTSAEFSSAFDAVVANLGACAQAPNDPACTNLIVPHNREGGMLYMVDMFTKAQRRTDAESGLQQLMAGAGYPSWSYSATATERLQQLDARIALFGNDNPNDDPPAAWGANNQCSLCHQQ